MAEAWDILPDKERTAETVANFIIFCEDGATEPAYFESFQMPDKLKVNAVAAQDKRHKQVNKALAYCYEKGLAEMVDGAPKLKDDAEQYVWCVYDRDLENEDLSLINLADDFEFTNSVKAAQSAGLNAAWSNDAFELWILLHFENVPTGERLHRNYIYTRLTDIFRNLPGQIPEMSRRTGHEKFDYKKFMKHRNDFLWFVKPFLENRRTDAIDRAKALELLHASAEAVHARNPCTMVHHLVESLLFFSNGI